MCKFECLDKTLLFELIETAFVNELRKLAKRLPVVRQSLLPSYASSHTRPLAMQDELMLR